MHGSPLNGSFLAVPKHAQKNAAPRRNGVFPICAPLALLVSNLLALYTGFLFVTF